MGVTSLSWLDIEAWSRIRGHELSYTELELVRVIDTAFVTNASKGK